jgi:hypothetical protein
MVEASLAPSRSLGVSNWKGTAIKSPPKFVHGFEFESRQIIIGLGLGVLRLVQIGCAVPLPRTPPAGPQVRPYNNCPNSFSFRLHSPHEQSLAEVVFDSYIRRVAL